MAVDEDREVGVAIETKPDQQTELRDNKTNNLEQTGGLRAKTTRQTQFAKHTGSMASQHTDVWTLQVAHGKTFGFQDQKIERLTHSMHLLTILIFTQMKKYTHHLNS